jgi:hypothetical protein
MAMQTMIEADTQRYAESRVPGPVTGPFRASGSRPLARQRQRQRQRRGVSSGARE